MNFTTPLPHQKTGVVQIEDFGGRCLLADEMGLGKSLEALMYGVRNRETTYPMLVICDATLKYNWANEAAKHCGLPSDVLNGRKPRDAPPPIIPKLTIINYDIIAYWEDYLKDMNFGLIIIDECQAIKNQKAKRTKCIRYLCKGVPHVVALSGTPLTNRPAELWPTLNILRPDVFNSFFSYGHQFCRPRKTPWGWQFTGATDLDVLHQKLKETCMVRRLKKDVIKDLPDIIRNVIPIDIRKSDEYKYAERDFMTFLRSRDAAAATRASKAKKLTRMSYLRMLAAKLKLQGCVMWCNNWLQNTDDKMILFAYHKEMIKALRRQLDCKSTLVDGSVKGKVLEANKAQFQNDTQTRVIVGSNSMCRGHNLTAASTVTFAELFWVPAWHLQGEARPHRIGQKGTVWANYLVAKDTLEEDVCDLLQEKQDVIRHTLDGDGGGHSLDIFDELLARYEEKANET